MGAGSQGCLCWGGGVPAGSGSTGGAWSACARACWCPWPGGHHRLRAGLAGGKGDALREPRGGGQAPGLCPACSRAGLAPNQGALACQPACLCLTLNPCVLVSLRISSWTWLPSSCPLCAAAPCQTYDGHMIGENSRDDDMEAEPRAGLAAAPPSRGSCPASALLPSCALGVLTAWLMRAVRRWAVGGRWTRPCQGAHQRALRREDGDVRLSPPLQVRPCAAPAPAAGALSAFLLARQALWCSYLTSVLVA